MPNQSFSRPVLISTILLLTILACGGQAAVPPIPTEVIIGQPVETATAPPPSPSPTPTLTRPAVAPAFTWQKFTAEALGFSVLLPQTPTETNQIMTAAGQETEMTLYSVAGLSEAGTPYTYLVGHMAFPETIRDATDQQIEQLLDETQAGLLANLQGQIVEQRTAPLEAYPGREIEIKGDQFRMIYRFILAETDLYQIAARIEPGASFSADDERFLNSFRLLGRSLAGPSTPAPESAANASQPLPAVPQWEPFNSETGQFSILFPTPPEEIAQPIPGQAAELRVFSAPDNDTETLYMVLYNELPPIFTEADETLVQQALDQGRDGGLQNVDGTLVSEESVSLDGYPGRAIAFTMSEGQVPGGGQGAAHFYLIEDRFFQLLVIGQGDALPREDVAQFFASFEVIE